MEQHYQSRERVRKSFEALNKLGSVMQMSVTPEYVNLKLDELRLTSSMSRKNTMNRKNRREFESRFGKKRRPQKEMDKAREDAGTRRGPLPEVVVQSPRRGVACYRRAVDEIDRPDQLVRGRVGSGEKSEGACCLSRTTHKIWLCLCNCNIGSFGGHIFKIGITRRLEPTERIDELDDASFRSHST